MGRLFLRTVRDRPNLVYRCKEDGRQRDHFIPLDNVDREVLAEALRLKDEIPVLMEVPCTNPTCTKTVMMTKQQHGEFFLRSLERYDLGSFPYCGDACREAVLAQHGRPPAEDPDTDSKP